MQHLLPMGATSEVMSSPTLLIQCDLLLEAVAIEVREMEIPNRIGFAAERLKAGHRINRITVRDFLRLFGAERRGAVRVSAI